MTFADLITRLATHTATVDTVAATPEAFGFRCYALRRNPWRFTDRIETLAGTMYSPADYDGDFCLVFPVSESHRGPYYDVYGTLIPGNRCALGYGEVGRLTTLAHAGYRRIAFAAMPAAWQQAFRAEIRAALTAAAHLAAAG
jgi:hypothetical protein